MSTELIAYHGDKKVKAKYLARVRAHRAADELVRGTGWTGGRGCAVGCTLHAYDHARYPIELGVPLVLAHLEDRIFEHVDEKRAMQWPAQFLAAIPVGADLSKVWPKFAAWVLRTICPSDSGETVAKVFDREAGGDAVTTAEWSKVRATANEVRRKAWDKYYSADAAAAYAYAAYYAAAADAAAAAAAAADADAAYYAAAGVGARAAGKDGVTARAQAWTKMADQLLALLRAAPKAVRA